MDFSDVVHRLNTCIIGKRRQMMAENRPDKPPCGYNVFFSKKSMAMRNRKEALQEALRMLGLLRPDLLMNTPHVEKVTPPSKMQECGMRLHMML
jgi:hypothetical protein